MTEKGLYQKYIIQKTDGSPVDPMAKYFVLRYDKLDDDFGRFSRRALFEFARWAQRVPKFKNLGDDLLNELAEISTRIYRSMITSGRSQSDMDGLQ